MKILTVVGARPQFVKAAVVSHELRKNHKEILVHTGQHFDYNMSGLFFDELSMPEPDYNLGISGGTHGEMTGRMLEALEKTMISEKPEACLVYGDTNSTVAAALSAVKLHIPICHVEAGVRFRNMDNPEEINRIVTDHVSRMLLPCTQTGYDELVKEGLGDLSIVVGDPMFDAYLKYSNVKQIGDIRIVRLDGQTVTLPDRYYYLTCHRAENTTDKNSLIQILSALQELDYPVIYPVHPRNRDTVEQVKRELKIDRIITTEPLGYLENMAIIKHAEKIITDSGGVQREAFFAGVQCVTVISFAMWPETMVDNRNQIARADKEDILNKISASQLIRDDYLPFGDGHAAKKIVTAIESL